MACRPVSKSRPHDLSGKRAGRLAGEGNQAKAARRINCDNGSTEVGASPNKLPFVLIAYLLKVRSRLDPLLRVSTTTAKITRDHDR
jgi:hypothetical protein